MSTNAEQKWPDNLVIVRHAESERNLHKEIATAAGELVYGGKTRDVDVSLTARGQRQAVVTGEHLAAFRFDAAFASPYLRTRETCRILLEQFDQKPEVIYEERLREIEFGVLDGLTKVGVQARFPQEWERKRLMGKYYYRPPGGESYPDVCLRLHSFLGTLARDYRRRNVLVVCHSVIVLLFRRLLERLSEAELLEIDGSNDLANCGVTHYAWDARAGASGKLTLREFNRVYYPPELASYKEPKPGKARRSPRQSL